jgi:hypothetical protein
MDDESLDRREGNELVRIHDANDFAVWRGDKDVVALEDVFLYELPARHGIGDLVVGRNREGAAILVDHDLRRALRMGGRRYNQSRDRGKYRGDAAQTSAEAAAAKWSGPQCQSAHKQLRSVSAHWVLGISSEFGGFLQAVAAGELQIPDRWERSRSGRRGSREGTAYP